LEDVEETFSATTPANDLTAGSPLGRGRLMLRFVLGMTELTNERVGAVLSACTAIAPPAAAEPSTAGTPLPLNLRHAALGLLSDAVGGLAGAPARGRARWRRLVASARRGAAPLDRVGKLVGRLPGVPRAIGRLQSWRNQGENQLARWVELGRREEAASRILAFDALTVLRENMLARVSESPDLKSVIREQSEGIAVTAMSELRERSARADNLAERTVRRLFGGGRTPRAR
jgi:hypothetical protein